MTPKTKIYISLIICGVITILLVVFSINPFFQGIRRQSEELFSGRKKVVLLTEEKENLQKLEKIYRTYQPDLKKIEDLFVNPEIPIEFISFLEKNAKTSDIRLEISGLTKKEEIGDLWPSLSLQLVITGSFSNSLRFLERLENSPYLIEILDLNATKLTEKEVKSKEFEKMSLEDTNTSLTIKIFTQ